jgi:UDP-GlcNAc:undecaprenyl-phosphate GlcNAc-1-phosphate transferase
MGDTGSQFLGLTLAGLSIIFFTNPLEHHVISNIPGYLLILTSAFIIPITDTTTVFINRIRNGKSPFIGGKDHTTHNLSYKGYSDNKIALLLFLLSLAGNLLSFLLNLYQNTQLSMLILINAAFCLFVFFFLFLPTIRKKRQ